MRTRGVTNHPMLARMRTGRCGHSGFQCGKLDAERDRIPAKQRGGLLLNLIMIDLDHFRMMRQLGLLLPSTPLVAGSQFRVSTAKSS